MILNSLWLKQDPACKKMRCHKKEWHDRMNDACSMFKCSMFQFPCNYCAVKKLFAHVIMASPWEGVINISLQLHVWQKND